MKYDYAEIGRRIQLERQSRGWSQETLIAELHDRETGIGRNTLSLVENGTSKTVKALPISVMEALCDAFECDLGYLLGEYDERHRIAAEVCSATGLREEAAQRLLNLKSDALGRAAEKFHTDAVPRTEILSRILSDSAFWRSINYLFQCTTFVASDSMEDFNRANTTYSPNETAVFAEWEPPNILAQDLHIASATVLLSSVVKRAVGWESETAEK